MRSWEFVGLKSAMFLPSKSSVSRIRSGLGGTSPSVPRQKVIGRYAKLRGYFNEDVPLRDTPMFRIVVVTRRVNINIFSPVFSPGNA